MTQNTPYAEYDDLSLDTSPNQILDVLANDTDVDRDQLSILSFTQPKNGTLVLTTDGKLSYTPNLGFSGPDDFQYTVSDGNGGTDHTGVDENDAAVQGIELSTLGKLAGLDFSEFLSADDNMDVLLGESAGTGLVTGTVSSGTVADTTIDSLQQLVDLQEHEHVVEGY